VKVTRNVPSKSLEDVLATVKAVAKRKQVPLATYETENVDTEAHFVCGDAALHLSYIGEGTTIEMEQVIGHVYMTLGIVAAVLFCWTILVPIILLLTWFYVISRKVRWANEFIDEVTAEL